MFIRLPDHTHPETPCPAKLSIPDLKIGAEGGILSSVPNTDLNGHKSQRRLKIKVGKSSTCQSGSGA